MAIASTLINGRRYSFSSVEIALVKPDGAAELFIDVSALSYGRALTIEFVRGAARNPLGYTAGDYEPPDASMTLGKSTFTAGIVEGIGAGWLGSVIRVVAKYADVGEPLTVDEIDAVIMSAQEDHAAGPAPLNVVVGLKVLRTTTNGIADIGEPTV
jgi:hypothetical protein